MRLFYVVILVFALLLSCCSATEANITKPTGSSVELFDNKRCLRSTVKGRESTYTEERIIGITPKWLTQFRIWKLKREATFQMNKTPEELQKEMAEANMKLIKEAAEYQSWMAAKLTPADIYVRLGLANLADDATNSPNFRRYQAYMKEYSMKAEGVKASGWMKNWMVHYRLGRLKSQAAAEMTKADELLAKETREYERWIKEGFQPAYVYEKLGLFKLGTKATNSINFRHYEMYHKLWDDRINRVANIAT